MTVVRMPNGDMVDMGDRSDDEIRSLIQKKFPDFAPAQTAPAPQGGSALDPAMQGLTLGTADELAGVFGGAMDWLGLGGNEGTGSFSGGYNRTIAKARGNLEEYRQRQPAAAAVAEIAGALPTLAIPGGGAINAFRAARTAPALARGAATLGNAALGGAVMGGLYGAGTAEGNLAERLPSALTGAATGFVAGPAITAAGGAVRGAVKGVGRLTGLSGALDARAEAARRVVERAKMDAQVAGRTLPDEVRRLEGAVARGVPLTPLDIGEATRGLGRQVADVSPEARSLLRTTTEDRFQTQVDRLSETITKHAPGVNSPQKRLFLEKAAEAANKPAYEKAYRAGAGGIWDQNLEQLTISPSVQKAIKQSTATGLEKAAVTGVRPPKNPFIVAPDGSLQLQPGTKPTLEFWDHVKRNLQDQASKLARAGKNDAAGNITAAKNKLVEYLDQAVPSYKAARQGAKSFFDAEDALTAGQNFVKMTGGVDVNAEARKAIATMSQPERKLFGEGYATQFINDIRNVPVERVAGTVKRIFETPMARERFEIALGPQAAREMEATVYLETQMRLGKEAVSGGSRTARYWSEIVGGGLLGFGAGGITQGNLFDPTNLATAMVGAGTIRGGKALQARLGQKIAREIGDMLASGDPAKFKEAIRRVAGNSGMMNVLRRGNDRLVRLAIPAADAVTKPLELTYSPKAIRGPDGRVVGYEPEAGGPQ